jgi:uncharacterized membrane protein YgaE (UPF0421/DUF939 family)
MKWLPLSAAQLSVRAAVAASLAVAATRAFGLPSPLYAMIAAVLVTDLVPSRSRELAVPRLLGTLLGTVTGGLLVPIMYAGPWIIGVGVLVAMLLAHGLRLRGAEKLAGYVCAIVLLEHPGEAWAYAAHRCLETAVGIASAVALSFVPKLLGQAPPASEDR